MTVTQKFEEKYKRTKDRSLVIYGSGFFDERSDKVDDKVNDE